MIQQIKLEKKIYTKEEVEVIVVEVMKSMICEELIRRKAEVDNLGNIYKMIPQPVSTAKFKSVKIASV